MSLDTPAPQRMMKGVSATGERFRQLSQVSHHQHADFRSWARVGIGRSGSRCMPDKLACVARDVKPLGIGCGLCARPKRLS